MSRKAQRSNPSKASAPAPSAERRDIAASSMAAARAYNSDAFALGMSSMLRRSPMTAAWGQTGTGPNDSLRTHQRNLNRVREQTGSNALTTKTIAVKVGNIVQDTGFDPIISKYPMMWKRWKRWKKECDPRQEFSWLGLTHQVATLVVRDGACLVRKRERYDMDRTPRSRMPLQIQVMEIDQLARTLDALLPNGHRIVGGVQRDQTDRPVGYWIHPRHPGDELNVPGSFQDPNVPVFVDAAHIIHPKIVGRPGEARPSPPLTTTLNPQKMMNTYLTQEALRKKISSERVYAVQTAGVGEDGKVISKLFEFAGAGGQVWKDPSRPDQWIVSGSAAGTSLVIPPGYNVKPMDVADVPQNFEPYVKVAMQHIAAGAGIPYPFLTEDWSGLNDRMYRAMTLEFRRDIRFMQREIMIEQFCQPVFEWWVSWGITEGVLDLEGITLDEVFETEWTTPAPGYINPVQEIGAYAQAYELGIMSKQRIAQELGDDYMQVSIERQMGNALDEQLAANPKIAALVAKMVETHLSTLTADASN